jgi:hypothetical protein
MLVLFCVHCQHSKRILYLFSSAISARRLSICDFWSPIKPPNSTRSHSRCSPVWESILSGDSVTVHSGQLSCSECLFVLRMYVYVTLLNAAVLCTQWMGVCTESWGTRINDKGTYVLEAMTLCSYNLWFSQHWLVIIFSYKPCVFSKMSDMVILAVTVLRKVSLLAFQRWHNDVVYWMEIL